MSIEEVAIGTGVTSIGGSTFKDCSSLTNVIVPGSMTSIGTDAFCNCINLMDITIEDKTIEQVDAMGNMHWGLNARCTIHCTNGDIVVS